MDSKLNLYQRLLEVQKAVTYFQQNEQGDRFKYVASGPVLTTIREAMDAAGVILSVSVIDAQVQLKCVYKDVQHFTQINVEFVWINVDNPEERLVWRMYGQGIDSGEKGVGKALTYAEKYGLLKFFHIATGKHDDPDSYQDDPYQDDHSNGNGNGNGRAKPPAEPSPSKPAQGAPPPGNGKQFGMVGDLFNALQEIGCGVQQRNALKAKLGLQSDWPELGPAGWARVYEAAVAEKGGN